MYETSFILPLHGRVACCALSHLSPFAGNYACRVLTLSIADLAVPPDGRDIRDDDVPGPISFVENDVTTDRYILCIRGYVPLLWAYVTE